MGVGSPRCWFRLHGSRVRLHVPVLLPVLLLVSALIWAPGVARADGDPASDYLLAGQVFLTSQSITPSPAQRQLRALVAAANHAGFPIRVAVISDEYDLGSITALWRKPGLYARFLGIELSAAYGKRLLVVMPGGFGFDWPGHPVAAAERLLGAVRVGAGPNALAAAAQVAVRRLAAASGVRLAAGGSTGAGATASEGVGAPLVVGAATGGLAVLVLIVALAIWTRRRRTLVRDPAAPPVWRRLPGVRAPAPKRPPVGNRRFPAVPLRWTVPAVALVAAVPVGLSIRASRAADSQPSPGSIVTPPPFSWPAGARPAPAFLLHDQAGNPVSVAAYRGRPVIVTFIDPLCRNLCPLEAQVLDQVERQLPASQRPVILAVSVDVYANTRADLLEDVAKWRLVPQWRWAIGRPAQLAGVWKRYSVGVSVVTKRIASTTIHYVTHTEAAYVIDATGHERALFFWPFWPQDVRRVLRRIA